MYTKIRFYSNGHMDNHPMYSGKILGSTRDKSFATFM